MANQVQCRKCLIRSSSKETTGSLRECNKEDSMVVFPREGLGSNRWRTSNNIQWGKWDRWGRWGRWGKGGKWGRWDKSDKSDKSETSNSTNNRFTISSNSPKGNKCNPRSEEISPQRHQYSRKRKSPNTRPLMNSEFELSAS